MTPRELLLNEFTFVSFSEIVESSGLSAAEIRELVDLGVLEPQAQPGAEGEFAARSIELARAVRRLQLAFDLPLAGAALVLAYRERIRELERELRLLRCQLPGHLRE